jgi:hypothetical protein
MSLQALEQYISQRIQSFAEDLLALVQQSVRDSAESELAAQVPRRAHTRRVARKPSQAATETTQRSARELGRLVRAVRSKISRKPGLRMEQLAAALNIPSQELQLPIRRLLADKAIRTRGQKRGTRYFAR